MKNKPMNYVQVEIYSIKMPPKKSKTRMSIELDISLSIYYILGE